MRKRFLSLLCVLALCLGLLPVTALAAEGAPNSLYVGNQQVMSGNDITYWTTDESGNLTRSAAGQSWNVKYDPSTATLTLNGATIQGETNTGSVPFGAGIYAQCSNGQSVTLTIKLIGENTITGHYGIHVNAHQGDTIGADASLIIQSNNNGSLTVTGTVGSGLLILSGTGDASLTIENASVDAKTTQTSSGYAGVCVQSGASATDSPNISLSVDGGSLTASGTGSSDGILFYVGKFQATGATTSLTVSNNAIVDARNGGISASRISVTLPTPTPTGNKSNGIVFDGSAGTVYGSVTLQDNLEIQSGETLTVPDGSKLDCNEKLTNNGTILASGGTLEGTLSNGTTPTTPNITEQPYDDTVTEGEVATFTVEASAGSETLTYQWQQSTDSGSSWTNIESATSASYTISSTATDMSGNQYRCVVKSASGVGVISDAATLTVNQSVTPTSYSISANVAPAGAGTVTVNGSGTSATVTANSDVTLTATANDGYRFTGWMENDRQVSTDATYTFKATGDRTLTAKFEKKVTGVTLNTETLELFTGGSATLTATVEPSDAANQNVTWQSDNANVATVEGGTVTAVGAGETTITVQTQDGKYTAICKVTVTRRSSGGTPTKTPSQQAIDKIEDAKEGSTVKITLRTGQTKLDKEVFEELAGRDVTLEVNLPGGITWTVNGKDIPADAALTDIDMGVSLNTSDIPVDVINLVTGEKGAVQMTLKHDGEFGFTMTLTAPLGVENKGLWANLYHYNTTQKQMLFETAAQVDASGNVALKFTHASEYAIVLDEKSHELPFTDTVEGAWYQGAVEYVYRNGIMTGTSATTFEPGTTLSRAMVAQILYNLEGQPTVTEATTFTDSGTHWAAKAIAWAQKTGVVSGYEDNAFRPNKAVTREELAQMLYNYAKVKDYDLTASGDLTAFPDGEEVSSWAETAMAWANGNELINGHDDGTLEPGGDSTRAQAASYKR